MTPKQQTTVDYIKPYLEELNIEQLKAVKLFCEEQIESEFRLAAEGMVAAFDKRPEGEPEDITKTTQECALKVAKDILGLNKC